jgi:hypothetical protein
MAKGCLNLSQNSKQIRFWKKWREATGWETKWGDEEGDQE